MFGYNGSGLLTTITDYTGQQTEIYTYLLNYHGDAIGLKNKNGEIVVTYSYVSW